MVETKTKLSPDSNSGAPQPTSGVTTTGPGTAGAPSGSSLKPRRTQFLPAPTVQERNIEQLTQAIPALQRRLFHASLSKSYCEQHPRQLGGPAGAQQQQTALDLANQSTYVGSALSLGQGDPRKACDCVNQRVGRLMTEIFPSTTHIYKQTRQQNSSSSRQNSSSTNKKTAGGGVSGGSAGAGGLSAGGLNRASGKHVEFVPSSGTGQTKFDEMMQILAQENEELKKQIEVYEEKLKIVYKQLLE